MQIPLQDLTLTFMNHCVRPSHCCVNYQELNKVTIKDTYPLPLIEECLDTLAGNQWFSKHDANAAYWQIKIHPEDRKKTVFITKPF